MEALKWLERSPLGEAVRMTPHLYPVLESAHILGIALLVGSAIGVDLRLIGLGQQALPVTTVMRYLLPLSHIGFAFVALTGLLMFAGIASSVAASAAAPWKFGLIALAGMNIAIFHCGIYRSVGAWDLQKPSPMRAKLAGMVSALTWMGVILAGRFLAY
jgi:hypothetical protein